MEDYKNNKSRRAFGRTEKVICKLYISKGAEKWTEVYPVNISFQEQQAAHWYYIPNSIFH